MHPQTVSSEVNLFSPQASKLGKIIIMHTSTPIRLRAAIPAFLALAVVFHGVSHAEAQKKPSHRHVFVLDRLDLPEGAPADLKPQVQKVFIKTVDANPALLSALPEGTPTIDKKDKGLHGNKPFRRYMKKRNLSAYKVVVQVTEFEQTVAENEGKPGNLISCYVKLRVFGETMPDRVMAFTGDGSARVAIEVGKKIRDKDRAFAIQDALDLSVADAVSTSLKKLNSKPAPTRKKKKRRKR